MTVVSRQNHHHTLVPPAISSGVQQQQQQQRHNLRLSSIAKTTTMVKRNDQLLLLIITILTLFSITYSPVYKSLLYSIDHYYYAQEEVAAAERELLLSEPTTTIQGTPAGSVAVASSSSSPSLPEVISSSSYYPFTKVGNVHSTKTISRRRKLNRQYSITRYTTTTSNNNNSNNNSTVTYHNTIPESMMLLDGKLLWCPNAKAGTTSMYEKIIFPTKIMNIDKDNDNATDPRCYDDCTISAWKKFDKSEYKRNLVMEAPSFTVVRNPWDRLKSSYNNKIRTQILIPTDDNPRGFVTKEEGRNNKANNKKQLLFPKKIMTFQQYVNHVEKYPNANRHWQPHSTKCMLTKTSSSSNNNNNNNDTSSGSGGVFHYDYIIKLEDHGGLFPQIYKLFDMYKLPFPTEMKKELDDKSSSSSGSNNNNNNKSSLLLLDESLLKFYNEAASVESGGNGNINDLVKQVGRIYYDDVRLHNYSFPNNNNFLEERRDE